MEPTKEETFLDRLEAEQVQVSERVKKLDSFMKSGFFTKLGYADQDDLVEQLGIMRAYEGVLSRRLERLRTTH